jgi:hypothetical protein
MKEFIKGLLREGLISEGVSPIVYHFTSVNKLNSILKNNELYLTSNIGTSYEKTVSGGKYYFASFSRTKSITHGYGTKFDRPNSARIMFDGNKLGNNYKFKPIDYWQYPRTPEFMGGIGDEMEDRLISNNNSVPNINKYIISIDIFVSEDGIDSGIIDMANGLGITLRFFDNKKDFASGNSSKSIEPKIKSGSDEVRKDRNWFDDIIGALTYKDSISMDRVKKNLKDIFGLDENELAKIDEDIKKYHDKLDDRLKWYLDDIATSLSSSIHNNKSNSNKVVRYIIKEFVNSYKKSGAKSISDYLKKKLYFGKKTQEDFNKEFNNKILREIDKYYIDELKYYDSSFNSIDGDYYESLMSDKYVRRYLDGKIRELKGYVSNYIVNNNDMYRLNYILGSGEIKNQLNIKDDSDVNDIIKYFDDVSPNEIKNVIYSVINDVDKFAYDEIKRIQDENINQWN